MSEGWSSDLHHYNENNILLGMTLSDWNTNFNFTIFVCTLIYLLYHWNIVYICYQSITVSQLVNNGLPDIYHLKEYNIDTSISNVKEIV